MEKMNKTKRYEIFAYLDASDLTDKKQIKLKADLLKVLRKYGSSPEILNSVGEEVGEINIKYIEEV